MRSPALVPSRMRVAQANANVHAVDDAERAADAAAESALARTSMPALPSRACPCGGGCPRCRPSPLLSAAPAPTALEGPAVEALASGGRPLDAADRDFLEAHFGAGFAAVRVHSDARAQAAAAALGA